jgi:hypothetical protein
MLVALVVAACSGNSDPAPKTPNHGASCDSYDRNTCLESKHCTLHQVEGRQYECRAEVGACELGLVQTDEAACNARKGCKFEPATCFCACRGYGRTKIEDKSGPNCKCVCGGGKPSMCVEAK